MQDGKGDALNPEHNQLTFLKRLVEESPDALIAQNSTIPGTNTIGSSTQNIDRIRARGIEIVQTMSEKAPTLLVRTRRAPPEPTAHD